MPREDIWLAIRILFRLKNLLKGPPVKLALKPVYLKIPIRTDSIIFKAKRGLWFLRNINILGLDLDSFYILILGGLGFDIVEG
jgi:hypothetical protein